jgi:hypothetical protein
MRIELKSEFEAVCDPAGPYICRRRTVAPGMVDSVRFSPVSPAWTLP